MKHFFLFAVCFLLGCGYTTRAFVGNENIYVKPVINDIEITSKDRIYSEYTSLPVFIEKKLTSVLVSKFNVRGSYNIGADTEDALMLDCRVYDYKKEALRYSDSDDVTEQRLRLYIHVTLYDREDNVTKKKDVVGEATFFLSGPYATTESEAIMELVDDTARRVVDVVSEDW